MQQHVLNGWSTLPAEAGQACAWWNVCIDCCRVSFVVESQKVSNWAAHGCVHLLLCLWLAGTRWLCTDGGLQPVPGPIQHRAVTLQQQQQQQAGNYGACHDNSCYHSLRDCGVPLVLTSITAVCRCVPGMALHRYGAAQVWRHHLCVHQGAPGRKCSDIMVRK
jgi:hypothetical protein